LGFQAITHSNAIAVQHRIRAAVSAAGLAAGVPKRRLFLHTDVVVWTRCSSDREASGGDVHLLVGHEAARHWAGQTLAETAASEVAKQNPLARPGRGRPA
jgi:hypothetical protein